MTSLCVQSIELHWIDLALWIVHMVTDSWSRIFFNIGTDTDIYIISLHLYQLAARKKKENIGERKLWEVPNAICHNPFRGRVNYLEEGALVIWWHSLRSAELLKSSAVPLRLASLSEDFSDRIREDAAHVRSFQEFTRALKRSAALRELECVTPREVNRLRKWHSRSVVEK